MKGDDYMDEDDVDKWFNKKIKDREFEKTIKKIVAQCFDDYTTMMYQNRMFLKNKL